MLNWYYWHPEHLDGSRFIEVQESYLCFRYKICRMNDKCLYVCYTTPSDQGKFPVPDVETGKKKAEEHLKKILENLASEIAKVLALN